MTRLIGFLAVAVVALGACGGDDGSEAGSVADTGDAEAFCERLVELDDAEGLDLEADAALAAFDELVDLAPEEIDSDLRRVQRALEQLSELDESDPDAFGAAFEIVLDPALSSSIEDFTQYAEDECGVEVEGGDGFGDLSADLSGDFSTDLSSDGADGEDDEPSPSRALRSFLDEEYPDYADLASGISSVSIGGGDVQLTLLLDESVDSDTAVAICEATLEFADGAEILQIEVEVQDPDNAALSTGDLVDGCQAA